MAVVVGNEVDDIAVTMTSFRDQLVIDDHVYLLSHDYVIASASSALYAHL